ncbi:tyrosine-type recombinase/integrase [Methylobacterium dankookense]|uniref:Tyrosine recombinase XerC n=1 Tax=Methylobacterium dankookense TaxID=560405 RepID=A0A564G496_9HYPH|nr:tyrosine-type recombinase/integrase [Methylobacterium dankookense]GJD59635.1 Tyrosine recombinase XerC [Methylobacterium dankookense]VUF15127.1 Tyrosine recombinase XerC [Methylobacterium dankookense]
MPRPSSSDTRYLEQNHGKWRVTVAVPRDLQKKLGTRLKRQLQTDSLAIANQLKWQVVSELKAEIEHARRGPDGASIRSESLTREALAMAAQRARAQTFEEVDNLDFAVRERGEDIRGRPVAVEQLPGHDAEPIYDAERVAAAAQFEALAKGEATPVTLHHRQFIEQAGNKSRTQGDDERAIRFLTAWCEANRVSPTLEAISRREAVRFMDDLPTLTQAPLSPVTLKKYLNRLSRYWQWLELRGLVPVDVWARLQLPKPKAKPQEERSFTDEEVGKLLSGDAPQRMHDLMRIGALTGARLDAIVDLKVKDCAAGLFTFKPQKKESKERAVPIHPALSEIVARRIKGKALEDDVFPEWPAPKKAGSQRERSFKASNQFTDYRRSVGVDHVVPGQRRSLVNFHSFRRWFITKAEQADQPESIIAAVVGHKRKGMTLGRYSAGPLVAQARRCVEAVRLPEAGPSYSGEISA